MARSGGARTISVWLRAPRLVYLLPMLWSGNPLILGVSVVDQNVPGLISRLALQGLGAAVDLAQIEMRFAHSPGQQKLHELTN